jgi:ABC-type phosphate/phosphonate transport system substrate-binding protein
MKGWIRKGPGLVCLAVLGCLVSPCACSAAEAAVSSGRVRIGLVASLFRSTPESLIQVLMGPFKSLMFTQTGMRADVITGGEYDALARKLKAGKVQLGVFHGVEFAWARRKFPRLKPLIVCVNRYRTVRAFLVVRKGDDLAKPADLAGKTLALPETSKEHCRLFLKHRCVLPGKAPETFYRSITTPFDTEEALDNVVDGLDHAAVVDAVEWIGYQKNKPGAARRLRVLLESEPFPCGVVAYYPGALTESQLTRFREGMIKAHSTPRGRQLLHLSRLTAIEGVPEDYDKALTAILEAYPPPPSQEEPTSVREGD